MLAIDLEQQCFYEAVNTILKAGDIMSRGRKIILSMITIIIVMVAIGIYYFYSQIGKVKKVDLPKTDTELKISTIAAKQDPQIINIAFFGLDRNYKDEISRSDAIMIMTLDQKHKKIKISSIMRDSYVNIDGHGKTKINHAYAYGGPSLSVKTINENFDLNIRDYVAVDFYGLIKIIDSLGGLTLNIREDEVYWMNYYIYSMASVENIPPPLITASGEQKLNGMQAVAYTRIRYTAGGDQERTLRQRTVLSMVLNKIKETNLVNISNVVTQLLPYTETSMSNGEIVKAFTSVYTFGINNIQQERFPKDGYAQGKTINGTWYFVFDLEATKKQLHDFIFEQ